jgi:hypothetical protein
LIMNSVSAPQRTATTAKILLGVGAFVGMEALMRGSVGRTLMAACLLVFGGGLLMAARQAD